MDIALIMILTYWDLQEEIWEIKNNWWKVDRANRAICAIKERCIEQRASGFCFLVLWLWSSDPTIQKHKNSTAEEHSSTAAAAAAAAAADDWNDVNVIE